VENNLHPEDPSKIEIIEPIRPVSVETAGKQTEEEPESLLADGAVVVSLGKQSSKRIRKLEKGRGKLLRELMGSLEELKSQGTISATAHPIIVVVKEPKRLSLFG